MKRNPEAGIGLALAASALSFLFAACSSSGNGGGGGGTGLGKLSPDQQKAFQDWVASPVKSCQAIETIGGSVSQISPFGEDSRDAVIKGVDLAVYAQRTNGSRLISGASQDLVVVDSGNPVPFFDGQSQSQFKQSTEINGVSESVEVKTSGSGYDCVVTINGEQVAKIKIAKSIRISLAGRRGSVFQPVSVSQASTVTPVGRLKVLNMTALDQAVANQYRDEVAVLEGAQKLGYTSEQAKQYFKLDSSFDTVVSGLEFFGGATSVLSYGGEVVLDESAKEVLPKEGQSNDVLSVWRAPTKSGEVTAVQRRLNFKLDNGQLVITDRGLEAIGFEKTSDAAGDLCAADRAERLSRLAMERRSLGVRSETISKASILRPCTIRDERIETRLLESGDVLKLYAVAAKHTDLPGRGRIGFTFGDWIGDVRAWVVKVLDSSRSTLPSSAGALALVESGIQRTKGEVGFAGVDQTLRGALADTILAFVQNGTIDADGDVLALAVRVAARLGFDFSGTVDHSLERARYSGSQGRSDFQFAEAVSASYIQTARETRADALSVGYVQYAERVHNRLFELHIAEADLISHHTQILTYKSVLAKYSFPGSVREALASRALGDRAVIGAVSMDETMRAAAYLSETSEDLALDFLRLFDQNNGQAMMAARAWALGLSTQDRIEIREFSKEAKAAGHDDVGRQMIHDMLAKRPDSSTIRSYREALRQTTAFLAAETSRSQGGGRDTFYESKAKELSLRMLREGWTPGEVSSLETFAQLAASDVFCQDMKTVSLRLDCVGLGRFSKGRGGIIDPDFHGRYIAMAPSLAQAMARLVPDIEHRSIRREIKDKFFPSFNGAIWSNCDDTKFATNRAKLDSALSNYLRVAGDFFKKSQAERDVVAALGGSCP